MQINPSSVQLFTREGCDTISDEVTGQLLFYTDGRDLWPSSGTPLYGISGGFESNLSMQAITIVKAPGSSDVYYLFFVDNWRPDASAPIRYRTYNVKTNQLGILTTLATHSGTVGYNENLTAALHANNTDIWIITKMRGNNLIRAWRLTSTGVVTTPVDSVTSNTPNTGNMFGQFKVSPDRKYAAYCLGTVAPEEPATTFLYKFNSSTGQFTNEKVLLGPTEGKTAIGLDFSPDSRKLYVSMYSMIDRRLFKFRIYNESYVEKSSVQLPPSAKGNYNVGAIQLGPDGSIYIAVNENPFIYRISNPNSDVAIATSALSKVTFVPYPNKTVESNLGLPVGPSIIMATAQRDYRVYSGTAWKSVCAGDDIRYRHAPTTSWKKVNTGDKYHDGIRWETIDCSIPQVAPEYDVYDIVDITAPTIPGYSAVTHHQVTVMANLTATLAPNANVWVKETTNYNGFKFVLAVQWDGLLSYIVLNGAYGSPETSGKLLTPRP